MAAQPHPYSLHRNEAVRTGMLRILGEMAEGARFIAMQPKSRLTDSIHDLRVLIKRLRAYLWFLRPLLGRAHCRQHNSALRKAANRLSRARDFHAITSALTKAAVPPSGKKKLQALVRVAEVLSRGETSRRKSDTGPLKETAGDISRGIAETTSRAQRSGQAWSGCEPRIDQAFRQMRKAAKSALHENDARLMHEWRKKTKKFFHLLQLTSPLLRAHAIDMVQKVDELQETLGQFQDSVVAENHLENHPPDVDAADLKRTVQLLRKHRKSLFKEAHRHWRSILRDT